jgi:hypothetical protein
MVQYLDSSQPQSSQIILGAMVFQNFDAYFYSSNTTAGIDEVLITQSQWQSLPGTYLGPVTYAEGPNVFTI